MRAARAALVVAYIAAVHAIIDPIGSWLASNGRRGQRTLHYNGPNLPVWKHLSSIAYWAGPSLVGVPLVARAVARHARVMEDIRDTLHAFFRRGTAARP